MYGFIVIEPHVASYQLTLTCISLAGVVLGGFWGSQKPPPSQKFLLIVHKTFLDQWMVKIYSYHQR